MKRVRQNEIVNVATSALGASAPDFRARGVVA